MSPLVCRIARIAPAIVLVVLVLPSSAFGQATRTWVSGVGDDVNPCSRTAPCKTFAGAISKTAAAGEINAIDPGGFGAVTITKSITIDGENTMAGILAANTTGVNVNALATDKVILRGLSINGAGNGVNGIKVFQAKSVNVYNSKIFGFAQNGLDFQPSNANAKGHVQDSIIERNVGNGVRVAPPATGNNARVTVSNSTIVGNGCGITATNHLPDPNFAANCGTQLGGVGGTASANVFDSTINDHDTTAGASGSTAVFSNGQGSTIQIGGNVITGNINGLRAIDPGSFGGIFSFGGNRISGNAVNGSPNGTIAPARLPAKGEASMVRPASNRPRPTPRLSRLRVSPRRARAGRRAKVSFRLDRAAAVIMRVRRIGSGRRVGERCVRPTRRFAARRPCSRLSRVLVTLRASGRAGPNSFRRTTRRLGRRRGLYSITATPTSQGATGRSRSSSYRVLR